MRRADRLFHLVQLIRGRRLSTAEFLAKRLEVSERTIYRDVADLQHQGVPIEGEAGVGYRLGAGFDLPPLMFTQKEANALAASVRLAQAWLDPAMAGDAEAAWSKIFSVLPPTARTAAEGVPLYAVVINPDEATQRSLQLFVRGGGEDVGDRDRLPGERAGRAATEHDPHRPDVGAVGVTEARTAAKYGDLVQVVVQHRAEAGQAVLGVADAGQFGDAVGEGVGMPESFALNDFPAGLRPRGTDDAGHAGSPTDRVAACARRRKAAPSMSARRGSSRTWVSSAHGAPGACWASSGSTRA